MLQIPEKKLKELLLADGVIKPEQFDSAVAAAKRMARGVSSILLEQNLITEEYYQNLLAKFYSIERANLGQRQIDEKALRLLSEDIARQKRAIVFSREADGALNVALEDPSDLVILEFLASHLKAKIKPFLASKDDLNRGLTLYGQRGTEDLRKIIEENVQATLKSKVKEKILCLARVL